VNPSPPRGFSKPCCDERAGRRVYQQFLPGQRRGVVPGAKYRWRTTAALPACARQASTPLWFACAATDDAISSPRAQTQACAASDKERRMALEPSLPQRVSIWFWKSRHGLNRSKMDGGSVCAFCWQGNLAQLEVGPDPSEPRQKSNLRVSVRGLLVPVSMVYIREMSVAMSQFLMSMPM
jgi:hypothetical protein